MPSELRECLKNIIISCTLNNTFDFPFKIYIFDRNDTETDLSFLPIPLINYIYYQNHPYLLYGKGDF